ncbi:Elicitin [Phytophthora megakarya]|uniref:Elicitin n=1 Tax=Phytophthora megakarya TaxID=4795 RepID=A0A225VD89_9STRA|nr:Elicitin [Phytophthora megakarya]
MMSLTFLITLSLLAVASNADECSTSQLLTIASSSHLKGCTSDVGFSGFSAISSLSDEQIKAVCGSSACMKLMDDIRAMNFGDCIIQGTNISLGADILEPFKTVCNGSGSAGGSATSVEDGSVGSSSTANVATAAAVAIWVASIAMMLML